MGTKGNDTVAVDAQDLLAVNAYEMLNVLGEDTKREGLRDTPKRVAKMYLEMTSGLRTPPPEMTCFDRGETDQMIVVSGLDYYSLCEHHLAPFHGQVHIGYVADKNIVGLSKLARAVEWFAKRPQIQERLTSQIADFCYQKIQPQGIMVVVEGTHLCMAMRGVKKQNHVTTTTAIRGKIHRMEFFQNMMVSKK